MPLSETTVRKISVIGLVALVVIGAIFMVFALFFNRGTLTVVSRAPYVISVGNIKTVACPNDTCSVALAPGDYDITLKKEGYKDITDKVSVPIGGETKKEITFQFVPVLTLRGDESALKLFAAAQVTAEDLPSSGVFYEKDYLAYIALDQATHRQTLYVRNITDGKAGEKKAVTSFIRQISDYKLFPAIGDKSRIAMVDSSSGTSTLYMIDLTKKSRDSLLTYPLIEGVEWLPGSDDFLFEARESGQVESSVYLYHADSAKADNLNLRTPLKDVVPVSKDRLVVATDQYIAAADQLKNLEGALITLSEAEATPSAAAFAGVFTQTAPPLNLVDYSLSDETGRLIKTAPDLSLPEDTRISETGKSVYFLVKGKDYELQFADLAG